MKKIILLTQLTLLTLFSFAQFPVTQNNGSTSALNNNYGAGAFNRGIVISNFPDTISANNVAYMKGVPYIIISTSDNKLWRRNSTATQWVQISGSGGSGVTVSSYGKNATKDSTILLLSDGTRYAAKDSVGFFNSCQGLINGGIVTWDSLLVFSVTVADYCINNIGYHSLQDSVALATSDPSLPRVDVIFVDTFGLVGRITGVPAADPAAPQVDPASQLQLTTILVNAGATTPTGTGSTVIWDENTGTPEWTGSATGLIVNFNNTTTPYHLTKAADVGAFTTKDVVQFTGTGHSQENVNSLRFYIKLKSALSGSANIQVALTTATSLSTKITLGASTGFSKSIVGTYQNNTILLSDFGLTNDLPITGVKFYMAGSNPDGFYLDYITLNGGVPTPTPGNYVTNIYRIAGTDSVMKVINGVASFAFRDSSNKEYVVQGYGIKVDSSGRAYTVRVDTTVIQKAGNFIPLSGTTVGNPVTGDIKIQGGDPAPQIIVDGGDNSGSYTWDDVSNPTIKRLSGSGTILQYLKISDIGLFVYDDAIGSSGLKGVQDFTPNITDLDYTQKKYVDSISVISRQRAAATYVKIADTTAMQANEIRSGTIAWPGTIYNTPTTGVVSSHAITYSPTLANQSAYTLLGRGSGSGTPSFLSSIDSNWVTGHHTQGYYDGRYKAIGSLYRFGIEDINGTSNRQMNLGENALRIISGNEEALGLAAQAVQYIGSFTRQAWETDYNYTTNEQFQGSTWYMLSSNNTLSQSTRIGIAYDKAYVQKDGGTQKNIVTSVNDNFADDAGNVTLSIPVDIPPYNLVITFNNDPATHGGMAMNDANSFQTYLNTVDADAQVLSWKLVIDTIGYWRYYIQTANFDILPQFFYDDVRLSDYMVSFVACGDEQIKTSSISSTFVSFSVLQRVVLPSMTTVDASFLSGCSALTSVYMPNLRTTGGSSFLSCGSLNQMTVARETAEVLAIETANSFSAIILKVENIGTVMNVSSVNADITVVTGTTTPVLTLVQSPALRSATTTVDVSAATAPSNGQVLTATSSTTAIWQTPVVVSASTYTPTLTAQTNVIASTAYSCQYMRVGNTVTVSGKIDIDPDEAGGIQTVFGISLPIASNFVNNGECAGTFVSLMSETGSILADVTNDRAQVVYLSLDNSNHTFSFTFTYRII